MINAYTLTAVFILAGIPVSLFARFAGLKGLQIWLPLSIITAVGFHPLAGLFVASIIMLVSFAFKPYPPVTLIIMIGILSGILYSTAIFSFNPANFLTIAMILTTIYVVTADIILAFITPDLKSTVMFVLFTIPISWLIYNQIGWTLVSLF